MTDHDTRQPTNVRIMLLGRWLLPSTAQHCLEPLVLTELPLGTMGGVEDGNACSGFHASGCAVGGRPKESAGAEEVGAAAVLATAEGAARLRGCSAIVCAGMRESMEVHVSTREHGHTDMSELAMSCMHALASLPPATLS